MKTQRLIQFWGTITDLAAGSIKISGVSETVGIGAEIIVETESATVFGEVVRVAPNAVTAISFSGSADMRIGDTVLINAKPTIHVGDHWLGQIVNYRGEVASPQERQTATLPLARPLDGQPPATHLRRSIGNRLQTGLMVCDTLLPICRGQRMGLFAGSGVGKSMLIGALAGGIEANRVVIALIGERSREVSEFATKILPEHVRDKSVIVAATAGESPGAKKRAAYCAVSAAEHFRDEGHHVLLLVDSVTRFAEAHRETALLAGETPALHAFPPSTVRTVAELLERAGPGHGDVGDITAVFSVLVAGSDMEEPVADMMRGILDGHIVLSRAIAERGRYPAIDVLKSVSRSLPGAATDEQNSSIRDARAIISAYDDALPMVQAGLYQAGADASVDRALAVYPLLEKYLEKRNSGSLDDAFLELKQILRGGEKAA